MPQDAAPLTWAPPWLFIFCSLEDPAPLDEALVLLLDPKSLWEWGTFSALGLCLFSLRSFSALVLWSRSLLSFSALVLSSRSVLSVSALVLCFRSLLLVQRIKIYDLLGLSLCGHKIRCPFREGVPRRGQRRRPIRDGRNWSQQGTEAWSSKWI